MTYAFLFEWSKDYIGENMVLPFEVETTVENFFSAIN